MKTNLLKPLLLAAVLLAAGGCSNDDAPGDPEGTVTLNMYDADNGRTLLGYSDIYIDKAQNFVTDECELFAVGKASSPGSIRVRGLDTSAPQTAVVPGHGYVAAKARALTTFPSGKKALPINGEANYMKFCVVSTIRQEDKPIGAAVKYLTVQPESYGLPEFGSTALVFDLNELWQDNQRNTMTLKLPSAEVEYDLNDPYGQFECEKRSDKLILRIPDLWTEGAQEGMFALWLRIRESYTRVYVQVRR